MKKIFLICLIGNLLTLPVYAACDGGTIVTSTATYCRSNVDMNWWSAYNWCKANGRTRATMYDICPSWNGNSGGNAGFNVCPEISGGSSDYVWSSTAKSKTEAFIVRLSDGHVGYNERQTAAFKAFCR